jgi:hypothetical protein
VPVLPRIVVLRQNFCHKSSLCNNACEGCLYDSDSQYNHLRNQIKGCSAMQFPNGHFCEVSMLLLQLLGPSNNPKQPYRKETQARTARAQQKRLDPPTVAVQCTPPTTHLAKTHGPRHQQSRNRQGGPALTTSMASTAQINKTESDHGSRD